MSATLAESRTITQPTEHDAELAATASRALANAQRDRLHVRLGDNTELELPKAVTRLLSTILTEMANGNSVTLIPMHADLSTQEAANLMNVSRPYLIGLLEAGAIPFHKTGTHRRVRVTDLTAYQSEFARKREAAQEALAADAQELGMGYEPVALHRPV